MFMETTSQFIIQWYMIYIQYYNVRVATSQQILSIWKSILTFSLQITPTLMIRPLRRYPEESLKKVMKRVAWFMSLNFLFAFLIFCSSYICVYYVLVEGKYLFLLPVVILGVCMCIVFIFGKNLRESWCQRLKCAACTLFFFSISIFSFKFFLDFPLKTMLADGWRLNEFIAHPIIMFYSSFFIACAFMKAFATAKSVATIWNLDELIETNCISNSAVCIGVVLAALSIAMQLYRILIEWS